MTLILSGTDGLSDVDGSAATPAIRGTDANTGIFFPAADTIAFSEGGAEVARFDSSGNLGIGTSSPSSKLQVAGDVRINTVGTATTGLPIYAKQTNNDQRGIWTESATTDNQGRFYCDNSVVGIAASYSTTGSYLPIAFLTSATERMRIDSAGNMGLGVTPSAWGTNVYRAFELNNGVALASYNAAPNVPIMWLGANTFYNGTNSIYKATAAATLYQQNQGTHIWYVAPSGTAGNTISFTQAMTLDASGNLLVGQTSGSYNIIAKARSVDAGEVILSVERQQTSVAALLVYAVSQSNYNAANSATKIGRDGTTLRSLNAGGTVNASGADYAEYMTKAGAFTIAKGAVVGINAEGKLTNVFADAVSFCVKSTDPSYVGGDVWGNEDAIGLVQPIQPTQRQATEDAEAETDEEFEIRQATYESDKATFEAALESARQTVDRIAFAGQVPVNVLGATAGQYIIPVNDNGAIKGEAVSEADMTLAQYMKAVGKVIAIESDGRAKIIVKVA